MFRPATAQALLKPGSPPTFAVKIY